MCRRISKIENFPGHLQDFQSVISFSVRFFFVFFFGEGELSNGSSFLKIIFLCGAQFCY